MYFEILQPVIDPQVGVYATPIAKPSPTSSSYRPSL
jgi:hypothetical protein